MRYSQSSLYGSFFDVKEQDALRRKRPVLLILDYLMTVSYTHLDVYKRQDFDCNNGIDIEHDILKIAVIERHHNTGHIGNAFIFSN